MMYPNTNATEIFDIIVNLVFVLPQDKRDALLAKAQLVLGDKTIDDTYKIAAITSLSTLTMIQQLPQMV